MRTPSEAPAIKASVKIQAASSDMKRTHVDNKTAGAGFKKLKATGMHPIKMQCSVRKGPFQTLCLVWTLEKREEVEGTLVPCTRIREPVKT